MKEKISESIGKAEQMKKEMENHKKLVNSLDKENPKLQNEIEEKKINTENIIIEKPNSKFADVIGLKKAKETLTENVLLPAKFPDLFSNLKYNAHKIILVYGVFLLNKLNNKKISCLELGKLFL